MLTGSDEFTPRTLRRLARDLEPFATEQVLAPALTDVAGPHTRMRPVASRWLMHAEVPGSSGPQHMLKRIFDVITASVVSVLLSVPLPRWPVKLTSPGPRLFKEGAHRGGRRAIQGTLCSARLVVDAEARLKDVLGTEQGGLYHKEMNSAPSPRSGGFQVRVDRPWA